MVTHLISSTILGHKHSSSTTNKTSKRIIDHLYKIWKHRVGYLHRGRVIDSETNSFHGVSPLPLLIKRVTYHHISLNLEAAR